MKEVEKKLKIMGSEEKGEVGTRKRSVRRKRSGRSQKQGPVHCHHSPESGREG